MKTLPEAFRQVLLSTAVAVSAFAVSGCSGRLPPADGPAAIQTKSRHGTVVVSRITVRLCQWDPLRKTPENPALGLVKAIVAGDLAGADAILASRKVGVDDVLCIVEDASIRKSRIDSEKLQFRPPEMASGVGPAYRHLMNGYSLSLAQDPSLGKNHVVWLYGTPLMIAAREGNPAMVAMLLKRGANPNVFIPTMGISERKTGREPYSATTFAPSRPWATLCALTECYVRTANKYPENQDDCAELLLRGGAVVPPVNSQGQTALWDAVQVGSRYLVEKLLEAGVDPAHRDNFGMTVADCIVRELSAISDESIRTDLQTLLTLVGNGGQTVHVDRQPSPAQAAVSTAPAYSVPQPPPTPQMSEAERLKRIDFYEGRLVELRRQLADAKHDRDMNAVMGHGTASAQMRVFSLMDAIADAEKHLTELQDAPSGR